MNLFKNRDWEIYNFEFNKSSEYDNILINKDIENYYNDIISKPIQTHNTLFKSTYTFDKFYYDYIEPNSLVMILLIGLVIFLIIRKYCKDIELDEFNSNNSNNNFEHFTNESEKLNELNSKKNNRIKSKKTNKIKKTNNTDKINLIKQQNKLLIYKKKLDEEKQQILSIIDELSSLNENEYLKALNKHNSYSNSNIYENYDINSHYANNYSNKMKFFNKSNNSNNNQNIPHNFSDTNNYSNVNNPQTDESNKFDELYVEPPFI